MTETRIELSQAVAASRAEAWTAWTDPDAIARWWWHRIPGTTIAADARVGGRYRFESRDAGFGVTGEYLALEPLELLVLSWQWIDDGVEGDAVDTVTVRFADDGDGTLVTVVHETDATGAPDYEIGWRETLGELPIVARRTGRPSD
ncbi:SRPBCC domain-containing protein [Agrococcus citreus]|uniref:Activator of Hsp90 ATPase homologue 1/2-like C-terminal domain-containing protein n=1 Tax=Agrococcus citreus TaxID=84643 RepID=A0ABN1YZN4_9MICO